MSQMIHPTTRRLNGPKTDHNSRSSQATMDEIYQHSPYVKDGYTSETGQVELLGNQLLLGKNMTSDQETDWDQALVVWGFTPGTTLDYQTNGAPNYADVNANNTGGGGLPASAWVPNPMSPGPENGMDYSGQLPAPEGYGQTPNEQWGNGPGVVNMSPSLSAGNIKAGITIGQDRGIVTASGTRSWPNGDAG